MSEVLPLNTPRIMGLETEYMVQPCSLPFTYESLHDNAQKGLGVMSWGQFLDNGARFYVDTGSHPEYAGPECLTGYAVAVAEHAGDLIVASAIEPLLDKHQSSASGRPGLFKRTLALGNISVGNHENYYIRKIEEFDVARLLTPHLVSRIIFTGSGFVNERGGYRLDQRAQVMSDVEYGMGSTNNYRPFVLDRNEPLSNDGRRLQVLSGSSNMIDAASRFKFDSTSLVIRMIEYGLLPNDFTVDNPGDVMRNFATENFGDNFNFKRAVGVGGKLKTAAQIQLYYASVAKVMADSSVLNEYDTAFANLWYSMASDAVDGKIDKWTHSIDWLAKLSLLDRHNDRDGGTSRTKLRGIDISYHRLKTGDDKTVSQVLLKHGIARQICAEEDVQSAIHRAPDATRARERGHFITTIVNMPTHDRNSHSMNWGEWSGDVWDSTIGRTYTYSIKKPSPYSAAS